MLIENHEYGCIKETMAVLNISEKGTEMNLLEIYITAQNKRLYHQRTDESRRPRHN